MIKARGSLVMKDGMAAFLKRIRITRDTPILDTPGGERIATAKNGYVYPYVGAAAGATRAVLINTSFNVRGEPIVCTPQDAYRCFMKTDIDYLVVENCLLDKSQQPAENIDRGLHAQLALD